MARAEARAEARRHLGDPRAREGMREARVASWLDGLVGDLRTAPGCSPAAGAHRAGRADAVARHRRQRRDLFAVERRRCFGRCRFRTADRLVAIVDGLRARQGHGADHSRAARRRASASRTLDGVTFFDTRDFQIDGGAEPARVVGARVDPALLPLARRATGARTPATPADSVAGSSPRRRARDGLWRRSFGADPAVVGRTVAIDGVPVDVVGRAALGLLARGPRRASRSTCTCPIR